MNCAFCDPDLKKRLIEEGKYTMVFLSNPRLVMGHLLVVPKRHTKKFFDLTRDEVLDLTDFLTKYQEKVVKNLSQGTEITTNFKPWIPDSRTRVNHFHFHVLPRNEGDVFEEKLDPHRRPLYQDLSPEEEQKLIKLFKT